MVVVVIVLAGERFVGRVAKDLTEVGNRGAELCHVGKCSDRAVTIDHSRGGLSPKVAGALHIP